MKIKNGNITPCCGQMYQLLHEMPDAIHVEVVGGRMTPYIDFIQPSGEENFHNVVAIAYCPCCGVKIKVEDQK